LSDGCNIVTVEHHLFTNGTIVGNGLCLQLFEVVDFHIVNPVVWIAVCA
jgi:hypothetical protein